MAHRQPGYAFNKDYYMRNGGDMTIPAFDLSTLELPARIATGGSNLLELVRPVGSARTFESVERPLA